jgi:hypothetical protein
MNKLSWLLFISCLVAVSQSVTSPINALGTTLPSLWKINFRAFNDLMKQSTIMTTFQQTGPKIVRYYNSSLTFNSLPQDYPFFLPPSIYAMAEIQFYPEDANLLNQAFKIQFQGSGVVGVYQSILNKF